MNWKLPFWAVVVTVAVAACEKKQPQLPPTQVSVAPVTTGNVSVYRTWVGLLNGFQNAEIRAQVTGYLLAQDYQEGAFVKKDTILFQIDPRSFEAALAQAQADYAQAVAKAQLAQITLDRQTQLYKTKVISQQEYDTSAQDAQAAIAVAAAAQASVQSAQVNLNYCTIRAPFDGIVGTAQAQIGDLVGPGGSETVLTQMSQVDPIKAVFSIPESEYLQAAPLLQEHQNQPLNERPSKLTMALANGLDHTEKGKFYYVNRQINVSTGTITIEALFPNPKSILRPGLFAKITAPVKDLENAILVPLIAVVELQGSHLVSILNDDNTISSVQVKLGPVDGDNQVILSGLKEGQKVIVEGVEKVRPGMKVTASPYVPTTLKAISPSSDPHQDTQDAMAEASPTATPDASTPAPTAATTSPTTAPTPTPAASPKSSNP